LEELNALFLDEESVVSVT